MLKYVQLHDNVQAVILLRKWKKHESFINNVKTVSYQIILYF